MSRRAGPGTIRARMSLVVLVGLALTSICQGHDTGTHRLAPHLAFLGETGDRSGGDRRDRPHRSTDAGPLYTVGSPGEPGAHDVASLGVALPFFSLLGLGRRRRWQKPGDAYPHAAAAVPPESPPPQQVRHL